MIGISVALSAVKAFFGRTSMQAQMIFLLCAFIGALGFYAGLKYATWRSQSQIETVKTELSKLNSAIINSERARHKAETTALAKALKDSIDKYALSEARVRDISMSFNRRLIAKQDLIRGIRDELESDGNARPIAPGILMRLDRAADIANGDYGASERQDTKPDSQ